MPDIINAAQKSNTDSSATTTNQAESVPSSTPPPPPPPPPIGIPMPPTPIASPTAPIAPEIPIPSTSTPVDVLKQGANATKWTPTGAVPHHGVPLPDAPTPAPPFPVVSSANQAIPPVVSTKNNAPPPDQSGPKKGGKGKIVAIAGILLLLLSIPVGVFFISNQQKQIADVRSRASSTCDNGVEIGQFACQTQGDTYMYQCKTAEPQEWTQVPCNPGETCQGNRCQPAGGGGGIGNTDYYRDGRCLDGSGNPAETCGNSYSCDSAGGCNPACGPANGTRNDGQICDVPNGYCKTGFSCRPSNTGQHQKKVDGNCVWVLCSPGVASCPDEDGCTGQGGPPNPTTTNAPNCAGVLNNCSESTPCCAGQNLVCQNPAGGGQRVCQQTGAGGSGDAFCDPNGTFKCNRIRAHYCTSLNGQGQCNDNGTNVDSWPAGVTYANGCGQVDMVCSGGPKDGQLCGGFEIINQSCGSAPLPSDSPPPLAPTCQNIKVLNETGTDITAGLKDKTVKPKAGDKITLVIAGGSGNSAKYRLNGGAYDILTTKDNQGNFTKVITVPADPPNGSVTIEALLCTDGNGQTCQ